MNNICSTIFFSNSRLLSILETCCINNSYITLSQHVNHGHIKLRIDVSDIDPYVNGHENVKARDSYLGFRFTLAVKESIIGDVKKREKVTHK